MTADICARSAFDPATFGLLLRNPDAAIDGSFDGIPYRARIAIPFYSRRIERFYDEICRGGLKKMTAIAGVPFELDQFGLVVTFARAAEIGLHDSAKLLDPSIRALVERFGPVILRNASIAGSARKEFHRNIFPHLRFHVDRGPMVENQYSCFTRDPSDAEQRHPRDSSTLFIANFVAWLETVRSGDDQARNERGMRTSYDLFEGKDVGGLLGEIILDQPWNEPEATGEIAVVDNRTVLHATYNKDGVTRGYPIGARYLS